MTGTSSLVASLAGEELSPELESAILHGIQQARNEAGKHLEDYTKAVLRIVEPLLQKSIKGQWYIMVRSQRLDTC